MTDQITAPLACPHCLHQLPPEFLDRLRADLASRGSADPSAHAPAGLPNPLEPRFTLQAASFITRLKVRSLYTLLCLHRDKLSPPTYSRNGMAGRRLHRLLSQHDLQVLTAKSVRVRPFKLTSQDRLDRTRSRLPLAA